MVLSACLNHLCVCFHDQYHCCRRACWCNKLKLVCEGRSLEARRRRARCVGKRVSGYQLSSTDRSDLHQLEILLHVNSLQICSSGISWAAEMEVRVLYLYP